MNPEFQRNVWLELTPLRMIVMVAVLALAFFAAALTEGFDGPSGVAHWLYYIIVVIWGTRNAARSVVGEIRDRTWDGQRLSSLGAGTMVWGKLFGATVFNWFGGAICLVAILAETVNVNGLVAALLQLVFFLAIGVIAQAVSLLASLVAAGRRQMRSQFEVFLYQAAGIVAACIVGAIADPTHPNIGHFMRSDTVTWWGEPLNAEAFLLVSLALFAGWTLVGCYRQMRLELKLRNGPFVWLGFLAFMAAYVAGFDIGLSSGQAFGAFDVVARRLFLAAATCSVLGYAMVLLEPKSRVHFRWLGSEFAKFHLGTALSHLPCWAMSYLAAVALGVGLLVHLGSAGAQGETAIIAALLGFFTRDLAIVLSLSALARRRSGDLASLAILILLYALLPAILSGLHFTTGQALFLPHVTDPVWLSPAAAWLEAAALWTAAVALIALPEQTKRET